MKPSNLITINIDEKTLYTLDSIVNKIKPILLSPYKLEIVVSNGEKSDLNETSNKQNIANNILEYNDLYNSGYKGGTKVIKNTLDLEPRIKIDQQSPRLYCVNNKKSIPLIPSYYATLLLLVSTQGKTPLGLVSDEWISRVYLKAQGKSEDEIVNRDPKEGAYEFARSLRRYLRKFGLIRNSIIKRAMGGYIPGELWHKNPILYGSEVSLLQLKKKRE